MEGVVSLIQLLQPVPYFCQEWARVFGKAMLALTGGLQRTVGEYEMLLAGCGFRLERVIPTRAGASIVEARPS